MGDNTNPTIADYERRRERSSDARYEAEYLRELYKTATCGLPMQFTGFHYGTKEVRTSVARRVADMYLIWADEWDVMADNIEKVMQAMFDSRTETNREQETK